MTAVIYARYSSDSQREASIEGQLRDCKDYAEKNGITVVVPAHDKGQREENLRCGSGLEARPLCTESVRCRELQVPAGKERCPSGVRYGTHFAGA